MPFRVCQEIAFPEDASKVPASGCQDADEPGLATTGPGLSAHAISTGTVYRTYVTTARGLELAMAYYGLLDRTPMGRHEEGEETHWLRRRDEYETA
jgi:predicted dithiol-disulfide oxidoreductase (DUF899 family)